MTMPLSTNRFLLLVTTAFALILGTAGAASAPAIAAPQPASPALPAPAATAELTSDDVGAWLEGVVPALMAREGIVGATVAVVGDGEVVAAHGFGWAEVDEHGVGVRPVDATQTMFRIGSVSKVFVGTAVMQLAEQGLLDLDAPVADYLDFEVPTRFTTPITLRHLLTHTAGFEDSYANVLLPAGVEAPELRDAVLNPPAQIFEPGTTPAYSNYSSSLAAYVVERASGRPFAQYAQEEIFGPVGMQFTTFEQPVPDELGGFVTTTYPSTGAEAFHFEHVGLWPAGSVSASGADMAAFMLAHLDAESSPLLSEESLEVMHSPALTAETLGGLAVGDAMAISFYESTRQGVTGIAHGGDLSHDHAEFWLSPEHGSGIFVAFNSSGVSGDSPVAFREILIDGFVARYLSDEQAAPVPLDTSVGNAEQLAGSYELSRRAESTFVHTYSAISKITAQPDGTGGISLSGITGMDGVPLRFIEVEPGLWQSDRTSDQLSVSMDEDGSVEAIGLHPAFVLTPMSASRAGLVPAVVVAVIVLLVAVLAWPIRAIAGVGFNRPLKQSRTDRNLRMLGLLAAVAVLAALALWFVVAMQIMTFSGVSQLALRTAQLLTLTGVLGLIPAAWRAVRQFRGRQWWRAALATVLAVGFIAWTYVALTGGLLTPSVHF
ncbi:MAG: serine hydrolase domain-containing protein [Brooklawnia sp.]|jgi:CubicO group peptidase (beta-lactamase class C family)